MEQHHALLTDEQIDAMTDEEYIEYLEEENDTLREENDALFQENHLTISTPNHVYRISIYVVLAYILAYYCLYEMLNGNISIILNDKQITYPNSDHVYYYTRSTKPNAQFPTPISIGSN